jgi:hypothetical protein
MTEPIAEPEQGSLAWHQHDHHRGTWESCWSGKCKRWRRAHNLPVRGDEPMLQLAVLHHDHTFTYYPANGGWRIDNPSRCIVVGSGVPRTYVPLDNVRSFDIEPVPPKESS